MPMTIQQIEDIYSMCPMSSHIPTMKVTFARAIESAVRAEMQEQIEQLRLEVDVLKNRIEFTRSEAEGEHRMFENCNRSVGLRSSCVARSEK